jgi:Spy/CpxP family protein refolding chaperone
MNARFAHVLSRLSIVSVVAASAIGTAACNGRASTAPAPAPEAAAEATPAHTPGQHVFRQVYALDLRDEQRAAVNEIEQNLIADLAPHRETVRQVVEFLASGVESGELEARDAEAQEAALVATVADARGTIANAINAVHDTLDAGQRAALVTRLQEQHRRAAAAAPAEGAPSTNQHQGPIARLAFELGLTEEQKQSIRDAVQKGVDELFPDHKARREANQAKMKALAEAFVSDDFDAADHDLGADVERSFQSFVEVATRAVDVSGHVLTTSQRQALAGVIRSRAAKL